MAKATETETEGLCARLAEWRAEENATWGWVAEQLGVSISSLNNWRNGVSCPSGKNLASLLKWDRQRDKAEVAKQERAQVERTTPVDRGVTRDYVVTVRTPSGRSGTIPNGAAIIEALAKAGITAVVTRAEDVESVPHPLEVGLGGYVRGLVREELHAALGNGVKLSLS